MKQDIRIQNLYVPVFLGGGRACVRLANRLFSRHGLHSYLFSSRPALWHWLVPWIYTQRLPRASSPSLTALALCSFAEQLQAEDTRTPVLLIDRTSAPALDEPCLRALECVFLVYFTDALPEPFCT